MGVVVKRHAFRLHLRDADIDDALFHLEIGNAVTQKPARLGPSLEDMHVMAGARELLRAGQPGGTRTDDGDFLAGLSTAVSGWIQPCSMARSAMAHSMVLMVTGLSSMLSVQDASHGAGQTRPVTSGKLLVECRLRAASSQLPLVDEVVPVRDLVVHRTAGRPRRPCRCRGNRACRNPCSARPGRAFPSPAAAARIRASASRAPRPAR